MDALISTASFLQKINVVVRGNAAPRVVLARQNLAYLNPLLILSGEKLPERTLAQVRVEDHSSLKGPGSGKILTGFSRQRSLSTLDSERSRSVLELMEAADVEFPPAIDAALADEMVQMQRGLTTIQRNIRDEFSIASVFEELQLPWLGHLAAVARGDAGMISSRLYLLFTLKEGGLRNRRILEAINEVPREMFMPEIFRAGAYLQTPLPIGLQQTISQPSIIGTMTDEMRLTGSENVLEIGTGSGYQAAILSHLSRWVHTIERLAPHSERAAENLSRAGIANVTSHIGNGYYGLPKEAPFDAIMITAGINSVPPPLIDQLLEGGRIVLPLQGALTTITKHAGELSYRRGRECLFVPFIDD